MRPKVGWVGKKPLWTVGSGVIGSGEGWKQAKVGRERRLGLLEDAAGGHRVADSRAPLWRASKSGA